MPPCYHLLVIFGGILSGKWQQADTLFRSWGLYTPNGNPNQTPFLIHRPFTFYHQSSILTDLFY